MAQFFKRKMTSGETTTIQTMVGLNARTEPTAFIRGAFELLDHAMENQTTSFPATLVLDAMSRGVDMNQATVEAFMDEYRTKIGHPLQKEYGGKMEDIILGKGGRLMPQKGKWTNEDWKRMNVERSLAWVAKIRDHMNFRGWSLGFMQEQFSLDLFSIENVPVVPERVDLDSIREQVGAVMNRINRMDQRVAKVEKGVERIEFLLNAMYTACPELFDQSLRKRSA